MTTHQFTSTCPRKSGNRVTMSECIACMFYKKHVNNDTIICSYEGYEDHFQEIEYGR